MRCIRVVMFVSLLCWPAAAQGAVLTFAFEGSVSSVGDTLGALTFVARGDRFVYECAVDTEAMDVNPSPHAGEYWGTASSLSVSNRSFASLPPRVIVQDLGDVFYVDSPVLCDIPGLRSYAHVYVSLAYPSTAIDVITDTAVPQDPYDLLLFRLTEFWIEFYAPPIPPGTYDDLLWASGNVDAFYAIPEPAAILILAFGVILFGGFRGSRRCLFKYAAMHTACKRNTVAIAGIVA